MFDQVIAGMPIAMVLLLWRQHRSGTMHDAETTKKYGEHAESSRMCH
jgi:hypothetical protein